MNYRVVYDLATRGYTFAWGWYVAAGLILLGLIITVVSLRQRQSPQTGLILTGFGVMFLLGGGFMPWWDYTRLRQALVTGTAQVAEGPVQGYWTEKLYDSSEQRWDVYEGFYVGEAGFAYERNDVMAGFRNSSVPGEPLYDGLPVRVHYVTGKPGDLYQVRIVRLEVAAAP
ncbi:MAG: hypothetical protein SF053_19250 [Bacteroidia bacterium]|nr:hypothetical protein [Bacteroidia bacterium]